jgi:hypothetical protein
MYGFFVPRRYLMQQEFAFSDTKVICFVPLVRLSLSATIIALKDAATYLLIKALLKEGFKLIALVLLLYPASALSRESVGTPTLRTTSVGRRGRL